MKLNFIFRAQKYHVPEATRILKMETNLCRTCGRSGQNFIHIFKTEGLRDKIETCLPIVVSPHCLLPDTLCPDCLTSIENFFIFTKSCLQNIVILETQFDIQESSLKTKRKKDKGCLVNFPLTSENKCVQTEDYLNVLLGDRLDFSLFKPEYPLTNNFLTKENYHPNRLVDYEIDSDSNCSEDHGMNNLQFSKVILGDKLQTLNIINSALTNIMSKNNLRHNYKNYLNSTVSNRSLINEITERKNLQKRKCDNIESTSAKIGRMETGNKRKCSNPKKLEKSLLFNSLMSEKTCELTEMKNETDFNIFDETTEDVGRSVKIKEEYQVDQTDILDIPQYCLLCNTQLSSLSALAEHFMKVHTNIDSSNCESGESCSEKKKRSIPSLVKISDLRRSESFEDSPVSDHQTEEEVLNVPNINCPNCRTAFSTKTELFVHLQLNHSEVATYLCGICLKQTNSASSLRAHVLNCFKERPVIDRYFCQICCFGENNYRSMESHVLVHNFLWKTCQKEMKNFDPEDYIEKNPNFVASCASPIKNFSCLECCRSDFDSFRKFSIHRRNVHSIFHCDLCNKFYGRNSHLWKHVNRLHKNHPSITCQVCFKTSASKYHLAQHFAKIHQTKTTTRREEYEDYSEKQNGVEGFEFAKTSAIVKKQDSTDQENLNTSFDENSLNQSSQSDNDNSTDHNIAPKEIDPTHDLYTNILTNYTPPKNEGDYKCPKCSKGFHKRMLLRKHKKNCRPKLQKDLLTRCKTCARIFKDRQSLAKHLINYHSDYECEICKEKVPSKCEIVSHIRFQHPSSHLICNICENILRCKKDLLEHLADHDNSFVCQFCGDALTSKVKLKMHILSLHRKILSLSCGICLKLFETQQVLRNHVALTHKDQLVPLMSCPICGKNYGSKWKTFDHVNKSHGRFFKACKICLEVYETELQLESHIKTVHDGQHVTSNNTAKLNIASGKSVEQNLNLNNNKANFDSDCEENTEETENSQTSESEDDEICGSQVPEGQKSQNASGFPTQGDKISLLEKRLLGKTTTQKDKKTNGTSCKFGAAVNKISGDLMQDKSTSPKARREEDNNFLVRKADSHNSKRTVYENSSDPSLCEICHKTWPAKKHLWQHYIRCHKSVAATVCGICLKTNDSYSTLQMHLRETHPTLLHGQGFGSNFICRVCGRYHNASSKLRLHMVIHEKFDWALLENLPPLKSIDVAKENRGQYNGTTCVTNGDQEKGKKYSNILNGDEEIYDALIEQIEESSSSTGVETELKTQGSSSESNDTNTAHTPTNINKSDPGQNQNIENRLSFSNLMQTLKNHGQFQLMNQINENSIAIDQTDTTKSSNSINGSSISTNLKSENVLRMRQGNISLACNFTKNIETDQFQAGSHSYLSEDSVSSSISDCEHDIGKNGINQNGKLSEHDHIKEPIHDKSYHTRNIFRPQSEELDSAIKSISVPCNETEIKTEYDEFNESVQQSHSLNDNEIESAVGSIL